MAIYTIVDGELYHHGVKGMKWGVRKAKDDYKSARKKYRIASKEERKAIRRGFGLKGIQNAERAQRKAGLAYANMIDAKAKYKMSKAKNTDKAQKAELKTYTREMWKTGLPGSAADTSGRGKALYNNLKAKKGKEYADKVAKKVQNRAVGTLVGSAAVTVGAVVVSEILANRS